MMKHEFIINQLNPEPWTAANFARVKGGRTVAFKSQKVTAYQRALKDDLERLVVANTPLYGSGIPIYLRFSFWRDTSDGQQCDVTNLQKSTEDALQGILFADDKWVRSVVSVMVDQKPGIPPGLVIEISDSPFGKPWWSTHLPVQKPEHNVQLEQERARRSNYNPEDTF